MAKKSNTLGNTFHAKKSKNKYHTLKDALQTIYKSYVSLDTEMSCECFCCNVSMPSHNYIEFQQIISQIWQEWSAEDKVKLICGSIDYYFKNDFSKWGIQTLVKPCMLQDTKTKLCRIYENRPLSCRMFGLWPKDEYESRVDKFVKAYDKFGLKKEDFPLFYQCEKVKRVDDTVEITSELISSLYSKLDNMDRKTGDFTELQVSQKHNYRSFHDFLLLKVFGEEWLSKITTFIMAANKEVMEDFLEKLKEQVKTQDLYKRLETEQ